tara:strand:- start:83 stop:544 length:462 start_codon:yes stop_codon:yes gene_type:complete
MKRLTYWPQLFLGLTFNWGIVMGWTAVNNNISNEILILYSAAIFWTLGYDTIYGTQDLADDEIIGIKSTSVKFKNNIKLFVSLCYFISSTLVVFLFYNKFDLNISSFLMSLYVLSLIFQVTQFKKNDKIRCLKIFKMNNLSGLFLFFGIFLIN